jgi:hypothetical protein
VSAIGIAVIGPKRQLALHRHWALLPEFLDRLVINALVAFVMDNASKLAIPESVIESFEAVYLCHNLCAHMAASAWCHQCRLVREKPAHAVLLEAPREATHCIGVKVRFLGPVSGRIVGKED